MTLNTFHQILKEKKITPVYQPIVDLRSGEIVGYEGLVRGPQDTELFAPTVLFQTARELGRLKELEELCCRLHVLGFVQQQLQGKLFINSSPDVVLMLFNDVHNGMQNADYCPHLSGLEPQRIVMELTESERTDSYYALNQAIAHLRSGGMQFAIDDLGEGYSSLRLWSELRPEYVKIDKYFVRNLDTDALKQQLVRSICEIANHAQSTVIAEGIETLAELQVLQQLGVACGQGYLFARPSIQAAQQLEASLLPAFTRHRERLEPAPVQRPDRPLVVRHLVHPAPTVEHGLPTNKVYDLFHTQPDLQAVVVLKDQSPIGILRRRQLYDQLARLYHRELYGNKPCSLLITEPPLIVDANMKLVDLADMVAQGPGHHMTDSFVVTERGRYIGVGFNKELRRELTQIQMRSARYANPLTQLPGNVPIHEFIDQLLQQRRYCAICYVDLDNFKPYNDLYGYRKGDEVLRTVASLLLRHSQQEIDFVGHVGGDDFIVIFNSLDWHDRCHAILADLPRVLTPLYDTEHLDVGGYMAENRQGIPVFHPLISISLGVVEIEEPDLYTVALIADLASSAKAQAKKISGNAMFIERRRPTSEVRQAEPSGAVIHGRFAAN